MLYRRIRPYSIGTGEVAWQVPLRSIVQSILWPSRVKSPSINALLTRSFYASSFFILLIQHQHHLRHGPNVCNMLHQASAPTQNGPGLLPPNQQSNIQAAREKRRLQNRNAQRKHRMRFYTCKYTCLRDHKLIFVPLFQVYKRRLKIV